MPFGGVSGSRRLKTEPRGGILVGTVVGKFKGVKGKGIRGKDMTSALMNRKEGRRERT
jgi:hypothetical protein